MLCGVRNHTSLSGSLMDKSGFDECLTHALLDKWGEKVPQAHSKNLVESLPRGVEAVITAMGGGGEPCLRNACGFRMGCHQSSGGCNV